MLDIDGLLKKDNFCVLPFIHTHVHTGGEARVCCINWKEYGNVQKTPISQIYSKDNKALTDFRKEILHGDKLPESCYMCSNIEKYSDKSIDTPRSYREGANKNYGHLLTKLNLDTEEDLINNDKISLWDVRFSNLCNLHCRTCGFDSSSRIAEEWKKHRGPNIPIHVKAFDEDKEFFDFFEKNIEHASEFYFCGGESLLLENHYKILDMLVANKKFDTVLRYNTNMTTLSYKDKSVLDYWKQFKTVKISASIDAGWDKLRYIRGADWEEVTNNLKTIKENVPHAIVALAVVVSILNAYHFFPMYRYMVENKLIKDRHSMFFMLERSSGAGVHLLPLAYKNKLEEFWKKELETIDSEKIKSFTESLINEMYASDKVDLDRFFKEMKYMDNARNENLYSTFPELLELQGYDHV